MTDLFILFNTIIISGIHEVTIKETIHSHSFPIRTKTLDGINCGNHRNSPFGSFGRFIIIFRLIIVFCWKGMTLSFMFLLSFPTLDFLLDLLVFVSRLNRFLQLTTCCIFFGGFRCSSSHVVQLDR